MLIAPLLLLLVSAIFQAVLYFHALHVARLAADEGLAATDGIGGSSQAGDAEARSVLRQFGDPLGSAEVNVVRTGRETSVRVRGNVSSLVPGMSFSVDASVHGPVARFHP